MSKAPTKRILMLLENGSYPQDCRVLLQAESLSAAGYRVTVICPTAGASTRKWERVGQTQVYRYPGPPDLGGLVGYAIEYSYSILMQFVLSLYVFLRHGFDVIHMHTPPDLNAIIPFFYKLFGKKFVYDLHDLSPELYQAQRQGNGNRWLYGLLLKFEKFASQNADLLIATNQTQRDIHIRRCGADPAKCYVVRNGPNEFFLDNVTAKQELCEPGILNIGYVGVIGVQDGVDCLVRSINILVHQLARTNIQVIIVGAGPALADLKRLVNTLQLASYFKFTGMIPFPEVPPYIAAFDICSTPDPSNAYNDSCTTIKTMEYMAMRKPIVCFQTAENVKTAGASALYAEHNDEAHYARQLLRLLDDAELRKSMGDFARRRVEDGLTWRHQSEHLLAGYDSLFGCTRQVDKSVAPLTPQSDQRTQSTNEGSVR
jgi:glycosyltransferase involved in cell wall biosynthesis